MKRSKIDKMSDVEVLEHLTKFFHRIDIGTEFIQDKYGFLVAQKVHLMVGECLWSSEPRPLAWPLEPVAFPEDRKEKLN